MIRCFAKQPPCLMSLPLVDKVYCGLAQVDTEGSRAIDKFYVTYHGEPLNSSMVQLVTNTLQYTLSLSDVEKEESY